MKANNQNELFRQMASQYVEQAGETLRREKEQLDREQPHILTPRMDETVLGHSSPPRQNRRSLWATLAACILLALLMPGIVLWLDLNQGGMTGSPSQAASSDTAAAPAEYAVIPLSFTLPDNFRVEEVEQDREKSIYYLDDTMKDPVVMTLEYGSAPDTAGLVSISTRGGDLWGMTYADYSIVLFEKDGVIHTITCQNDINTLVDIGRAAFAV
ncbi:hypothetical protein LJC63_11585 [Ruminococcaceae bacterium OttesenSCG-928-L11]|nr:hypothetical protein [Ruminococcaceae bacterium OttesenSCG-928-L11]